MRLVKNLILLAILAILAMPSVWANETDQMLEISQAQHYEQIETTLAASAALRAEIEKEMAQGRDLAQIKKSDQGHNAEFEALMADESDTDWLAKSLAL